MPWPPDAELLAAWELLVADPTTFGDFAQLALRPLAESLAPKFPTVDEADLFDAATEALFAFRKHPERYDSARSPLPKFLRHIARCRMSNILTATRRHREGKIPWDSVEFDLVERNEEEDDLLSPNDPLLLAALERLTPTDREVYELMARGERANEVFAPLLGFAHLPVDEQRREVKKAKDRIIARLKRAVGGSDG